MGGVCNTYGSDSTRKPILSENLRERACLQDVGVDGRKHLILICALIKQTRFSCLRIGCCEDGNERLDSINDGKLLEKLTEYYLLNKGSAPWI
jgi:hypothetical protein